MENETFYLECKRCYNRSKQPNECGRCGEDKYIEKITRRRVFGPIDTKEKELFVDKNGNFVKRKEVSKLSSRRFSLNDANQQCSICMVEFEEGNQIEETSCSHKFHAGCLQKWVQVKPVCPECRMPLERSKNGSQQSKTDCR